jgi:hypothetical protein
MRTAKPANSRLFASREEIFANARLRSGPQRTRTGCQAPSHIEPVSETSQTARLVGLEPVSSGTLESRATEFYEQRQSGANRRLAVKDRTIS